MKPKVRSRAHIPACLAGVWLATTSGCFLTADVQVTFERASVSAPFACNLSPALKTCANIHVRASLHNTSGPDAIGVTEINVDSFGAGGAPMIGGKFPVSCQHAPWVIPAHTVSPTIGIDFVYDATAKTYRLGYPCAGVRKWELIEAGYLLAYKPNPVAGDTVVLGIEGNLKSPYDYYMTDEEAVLTAP